MFVKLALAAVGLGLCFLMSAETKLCEKGLERVTKEARHELVMLPYYGVFDNLSYKATPDGTVTLIDQVTRSTLKADAERALKNIEGVPSFVNELGVLPISASATATPRWHQVLDLEVSAG